MKAYGAAKMIWMRLDKRNECAPRGGMRLRCRCWRHFVTVALLAIAVPACTLPLPAQSDSVPDGESPLRGTRIIIASTSAIVSASAATNDALAGQDDTFASGSPEVPIAPPAIPGTRHPFRLEATSFDNLVNQGYGQWWGGEVDLSWRPSSRFMTSGGIVSQSRPGESERQAVIRTVVDWTRQFYTDATISGGGPNDPAAFFPRLRFDVTANLKVPFVSGLILAGGVTRLYFGSPTNGGIERAGAIYYWRKFVLQGNLNLNTSNPGDHKSKSGNAAVQFGQEGRYWLGAGAGDGREAWQTLSVNPQDVQYLSYSISAFARKWLTQKFGVAASYNYVLKHTAYRINGLEVKFFLDF